MFVIVAIKIHLMYFDLCISTHTQKHMENIIFLKWKQSRVFVSMKSSIFQHIWPKE